MSSLTPASEPLALHPDNPHYFLFRGEPTILITSGEHYGAVLNLDFDYVRYLDELERHGLNNTRAFSGAYVEQDGAFKISRNTLAPDPGRFICPWARSTEPCYPNGGNKFDLTRWDSAYFARLKDFVAQAGKRGVVVELVLFCPFYKPEQWALSPQNTANNVNGIGQVASSDVYTLDKNGGLLAVHEAMTRQIVTELNEFDNLYYEVCNEPYVGEVTMEWQHRIVDVIVETEQSLPKRHLISLNVANGSRKVEDPHPAVSIFNFHYASPPDTVALNYGLNKVIGDNETGFKGTSDDHYRKEAWQFILAGGGLYNNLDYSFAAGHEDGSFVSPQPQPGGGNLGFRRQMSHLANFMKSLDFIRMRPDISFIGRCVPDKKRVYGLSEPGRQYAAYLNGAGRFELTLDLPAGSFTLKWLDPVSGEKLESKALESTGKPVQISSPQLPASEGALRIFKNP